MESIELQTLDVDNDVHLKFTYSILEERARKSNIEIFLEQNKKFELPSFEDHVKYLKANFKKYAFFYILVYNKIPFAEIYLDSNKEIGVYQSSKSLKLLKKKFKNLRTDPAKVFIYEWFKKIMKMHKEIPIVIAKIHTNNKLSSFGAVNLGFKKLYECYIFRNE